MRHKVTKAPPAATRDGNATGNDVAKAEVTTELATELEKELKELEKSVKKGVLTEEEYQQRRASLIANGAPARPPGGKGGLLKFGMFGCLGVVGGFVILIVVIGFVISAALSETASELEEGADVRIALTPNVSAEIWPGSLREKRSKVTILQIVDGAQSSNEFTRPGDGKKYYALEVLVENVGSQEVGSLDWKMRDSNDRELDRTFVSSIGEDIGYYSDLTPGGKAQGWVIFEMDESATPKWIRADPNPFLKNDLYFDAQ